MKSGRKERISTIWEFTFPFLLIASWIIQIQADDIRHNLPDNLEIIDPKTLGLSGADLEKFLGNVKILPIEGSFGSGGIPKTQILTVGFDGDERLNLQDFESISTAGLPAADKEVAEMAFKKFQTFFQNPQSAQNFDDAVENHGGAAFYGGDSVSTFVTTAQPPGSKDGSSSKVKHRKRLRNGKRPIYSSTYSTTVPAEDAVEMTTQRYHLAQSESYNYNDPQVALINGDHVGHGFLKHRPQHYAPQNSVTNHEPRFHSSTTAQNTVYDQVTPRSNFDENYYNPPAHYRQSLESLENGVHQSSTQSTVHGEGPTVHGEAEVGHGGPLFPHQESIVLKEGNSQHVLRASQANQVPQKYPYVAKQQQFSLRPPHGAARPFPSIKPQNRKPIKFQNGLQATLQPTFVAEGNQAQYVADGNQVQNVAHGANGHVAQENRAQNHFQSNQFPAAGNQNLNPRPQFVAQGNQAPNINGAQYTVQESSPQNFNLGGPQHFHGGNRGPQNPNGPRQVPQGNQATHFNARPQNVANQQHQHVHVIQEHNYVIHTSNSNKNRQQKQINATPGPSVAYPQQTERNTLRQNQNHAPLPQNQNFLTHLQNFRPHHFQNGNSFLKMGIRPSQLDPINSNELNQRQPAQAESIEIFKIPKRDKNRAQQSRNTNHVVQSHGGAQSHVHVFPAPAQNTPKSISMTGVIQITPSTPLIPLSTVENAMTAHRSLMQMLQTSSSNEIAEKQRHLSRNQIPGSSDSEPRKHYSALHSAPSVNQNNQQVTAFQPHQTVPGPRSPPPLSAIPGPIRQNQRRPLPQPPPPPPPHFRQDPLPMSPPNHGAPPPPHFMPEPPRFINAPPPPRHFVNAPTSNRIPGNGFQLREHKSMGGAVMMLQSNRNAAAPPHHIHQERPPRLSHPPAPPPPFNGFNGQHQQFRQEEPELELDLAPPPPPHIQRFPPNNAGFRHEPHPHFHREATDYASSLGVNVQSINSAPLIGSFVL